MKVNKTTGKVTVVKDFVGTATITITAKADENYKAAKKTVKITVQPAGTSLAGAKVSVEKQTYTGKALKPAPKVTLNGVTLTKGTDYKVTYENNKAAGIATVTVTGKGNYTGTATGTFKILTEKPVISKVKNVSTGVKVTWGKVAGAASYQVYRKASGGKWTALGTTSASSYTDTTAAAGTRYAYKVRCIGSDGKTAVSGFSASKAITYIAAPTLNKPKNVKSGVKLTWTESAGAVKYAVYRKASGGSWEKLGVTAKTSYVDKTAQAGTRYAYKVRCVAKNGRTATSVFSASKAITRKQS